MPDRQERSERRQPEEPKKPELEAQREAEGRDAAGTIDTSAPPPPGRGPVLVIAAHPDDPEFGCGATQAKYVEEGRHVVVAVVTSGDEGGEDPTVPDSVLTCQREDEQKRASAQLGVKTIEFLRFPDGRVENTLELRREIVRLIRKHKPESVFTHDPGNFFSDGYLNHPDHRAVGHATLDAIFPAAGNPRSFRELLSEGLEAHKIKDVYLFFTAQANAWIDVSGCVEKKAAALREHASQIKKPEEMEKRLLEWAEKTGEPHGVKAAEGFRRIVFNR